MMEAQVEHVVPTRKQRLEEIMEKIFRERKAAFDMLAKL